MKTKKFLSFLGWATLFLLAGILLWQPFRQVRPIDWNALSTADAATRVARLTQALPIAGWEAPLAPSEPETAPPLSLPWMLVVGLLAEAACLWLGWQLVRRRWYFLGYVAGLAPLFTLWYFAEREALMQCVDCYRRLVYVPHGICCAEEYIPLVPYTQIATIVNALYSIVMSGLIIRHHRESSLVENERTGPAPRKIGHPLAYALCFHAFVVGGGLLSVKTMIVRAPMYSLGSLNNAKNALWAGFLSLLPAFLFLWALLAPMWKQINLGHQGGKGQANAFPNLILLFGLWLTISLGCWVLIYGLMGL